MTFAALGAKAVMGAVTASRTAYIEKRVRWSWVAGNVANVS